MAVTPVQALARLTQSPDELERICARHGVRVMTAFGSAARGNPDARDLDLAVAFEPGHRRDVLALLAELVDLAGADAIDLMELDRAGPVARERALVATMPLFESEPGALARLQMAAMLERMDTDWLRRLDLDLLAQR